MNRLPWRAFPLLLATLAVLPAAPASADCATVFELLEGVVSKHDRTFPYPFQSTCAFWISKVVVREGDERYFAYVTPATVCYFDGSPTPGDCATISAGDQIDATWERKAGSLNRGDIVEAHIVRSALTQAPR